MNFLLILLIFLVWRIGDFLILYLIPRFIPYLGFFPYKEILPLYNLPDWITKLANFDGTHYLLISQQGYMTYEQAFFPLYPILIKLITPLVNNTFISAFLISNISFVFGLIFFKKLLKEYGLKLNQIYWTLIFLLIFPASYFFGAIYTEGLFFLLFTSSLYFLKKKQYMLVGICVFFASLTRLIGVFLIIPIFFHFVQLISEKHRITKIFSMKNMSLLFNKQLIFLISLSILGLLSYCVYLWKTTGNPIFFFSSQPIFGAHRSTNLIILPQVYWRYFKIMITAAHDSRYFISMFEMLMFSVVFLILILYFIKLIKKTQWEQMGLLLFSIVNIILPTLTGTFSSIPRYALFSISIFIWLGLIKHNLIKSVLVLVFVIGHIIMLGLFAQGYFVG